MKIKFLALLAFSFSFLGGCSQNGNSSATPLPTTTEPGEFTPEYLTFVEKGKIRIDLFDVDVQFSYGNEALPEATNVKALKKESYISISGSSSEETKYHLILFAEKEGRYTAKYLSTRGDDLVNFFELGSIRTFFNDYDSERGYAAISTGAEAKWTKGLNESFDVAVNGVIPKIPTV